MPDYSSDYIPVPSIQKHYAPLSDNGISIAKPDMNTFNSVIARVTQEAPDFVKNGELLIPYKTRLDETLRYTDPDIGFNPFDGRLEYKYADAHPVATFRNNIVSGGARFLGAALEAIGTIPIAINAASNKDFSKLYNNDFTNSIHDFLDTLNTELPTYRSEYEDEHPILKYLNPLKLGSFAGAWGGAVNNFGYTAGAIAGALVEDAVITALTGGAGLFPALAANATQIVRGLSRASKVVVESGAEVRHAMQLVKAADNSLEAVEGTLRGGVSAGRELALTGQAGKFATGTGMKGQSINNFAENIAATGVKKREQIIKNAYTYFKHFRDPAKYHLALLTSAAAEGAFEAADVRHNAEKELRQQFFDTYGHDASPEQLESFKRQAVEAANLTMGANIALLYLTNRLNWGSLFKPTKSALKEGIIGWGRNISRSKVTGVFDDKVGDFVYDVSKNVPSSRIGKVLLNGEKLLKIGAEKGLVESFEEGAQFTFSQGSVDYILNKYNADNRQQVGDYMSSFLKGINDTFNTNEGLDNLMGGFIGGIFGGAVMNRVIGRGSVKDQLNTQAKLMNRWNLKGSMEDKMQEVANTVKLAQGHKQAVEAKDTFAAKNFKFKMLFNWVASGVRANGYESRMSELDDVRGFTDDKFEKYWGVEYTPENVEYINNYLDGVKSKAAEIKKDVERIDYLTKNPYNRTKSPLDYNAYESYKDLLALNLSQSREYRRRMESVQNSLRNLAPGLDIQKAVYLTSLQGIRQTMDDVQTNIDQLGLQIKEAQGNEELVNSLYKKHQSLTDILRRLQPLVLNTKVSEEGETIESAFNGKEYVEALQDLFDLYNGIDLQNNKYIERKQKLLGEPNTIYIDGQKEATDSDKLADALEQLQDLRKLAEANFGVERYYHYLRTGKGADEFLKNIKNYATSQMEKIIDQTTGSIKPPEQVEEEVEEQIRFEQGFSQEAEDEIKDDENGSKEEKRENIRKAAKKVVKNQKLTSEEEDLAENHPTAFAHEVKIQQKVKKVIDELLNGVISEVLDSATSSNVSSNNVLTVHDVFGMFSQDKNDMTNRTNLYNAIFNSTDGVFNKIKAVFGLVEPENVVYTKIGKTELYRKSFEENLTITHNNIPIGILRPPTSVYLDAAGERSIFDLKEDEYEKITGNPKNTYSEFMNSLRAYRDSYNKLKAEIEEKQEAGGEVTYQDIAKYFSLSINTGSRKSNTNPANDVILRNLEYKPSGTALISVTLDTIEVKNGVSQKVSVPTIVNRSQLSAEQIAELEKFLETNKDLIAKNINRYAIVVPVLGKYVNKGIIFARNANTNNEEKTRFYNIIKEVASGVYNEDEDKINELINNIAEEFFLANTDRTTKQVFVNLLFDLDGNTVIHVFNNEKGVNKYVNIPKEVVQKTQNYAELINAFNNEISKQESNDRTFASLKLTITQDSLKRQLPKDENITDLKQVEDKLQLAISNPQVFENFNINFTPKGDGKVVSQPVEKEQIIEPVLPSDLVGSKPNYNYGNHHFNLEFETDIDKAAFIASQATKSKRDADFVKFVMDNTGLTEEKVRELGKLIRDDIKHNAQLIIEARTGESIISVDKTYDEFLQPENKDIIEPVYVKDKAALIELLGKYFGLDKEKAETASDIFERVSQSWATRTGRPVEEFFQTLGFGEQELFNQNYKIGDPNTLFSKEQLTQIDKEVGELKEQGVKYPENRNLLEDIWYKTQTPTFKKWFGDSKAVDEYGDPIVYFHGTTENWEVFDKESAKLKSRGFRDQIYLTQEYDFANDYTKQNGNILSLFVKTSKPFDYENQEHLEDLKYNGPIGAYTDLETRLNDIKENNNWDILEDSRVQEFIKNQGYDGFYIKEQGIKNLAVYEPNQIKRLNSKGFDTNNDNINYQINDIQKIIKGFELQPVYSGSLFVGFRTKNDIANRTIVKAIYKWSKENDLNVIPRYNLTYGTIELVPVKSTGVLFQLNTWHGSPYNISRFSTSRVYTGEGQTVFGWGLYFTDLKGIAEHYANKLNWKNKLYKFNSLTIEELSKKSSGFHPMVAHFLTKVIANNPINNAALYSEYLKLKESKKINVSEKVDNQIKFLIENAKIDNNKKRNLYRVTLHKGKSPEQYTWLEWDKPISKSIKDKLKNKLRYSEHLSYYLSEDAAKNGEFIYRYLSNKLDGDKQASLFLLENGIDGVKYPAESISRGTTSDNARGFNYVVFDENAIEIEEHIVFQNAKAAYDKLKQIIYALTNPNVSSPIHELAHFWHGITEGKDKNTLLTDEEIKQVLEWAKTSEWTTETSEAFAKGFETYLAEGKAPSPELENVFQKFAKWLAEIYKDIKQALGIELNDNMRQIYARMLNSDIISEAVSSTISEANNINGGKQKEKAKSSFITALSKVFKKVQILSKEDFQKELSERIGLAIGANNFNENLKLNIENNNKAFENSLSNNPYRNILDFSKHEDIWAAKVLSQNWIKLSKQLRTKEDVDKELDAILKQITSDENINKYVTKEFTDSFINYMASEENSNVESREQFAYFKRNPRLIPQALEEHQERQIKGFKDYVKTINLDAHYSTAFKILLFNDVLKFNMSYSRKEDRVVISKRGSSTTSDFTNLSEGFLSLLNNEKFAKSSKSLIADYLEFSQNYKPNTKNIISLAKPYIHQVTENGIWYKFDDSNDENMVSIASKFAETTLGQKSSWCTTNSSSCKNYISKGSLYIFYNNVEGRATLQLSFDKGNNALEIGGNNVGQSIYDRDVKDIENFKSSNPLLKLGEIEDYNFYYRLGLDIKKGVRTIDSLTDEEIKKLFAVKEYIKDNTKVLQDLKNNIPHDKLKKVYKVKKVLTVYSGETDLSNTLFIGENIKLKNENKANLNGFVFNGKDLNLGDENKIESLDGFIFNGDVLDLGGKNKIKNLNRFVFNGRSLNLGDENGINLKGFTFNGSILSLGNRNKIENLDGFVFSGKKLHLGDENKIESLDGFIFNGNVLSLGYRNEIKDLKGFTFNGNALYLRGENKIESLKGFTFKGNVLNLGYRNKIESLDGFTFKGNALHLGDENNIKSLKGFVFSGKKLHLGNENKIESLDGFIFNGEFLDLGNENKIESLDGFIFNGNVLSLGYRNEIKDLKGFTFNGNALYLGSENKVNLNGFVIKKSAKLKNIFAEEYYNIKSEGKYNIFELKEGVDLTVFNTDIHYNKEDDGEVTGFYNKETDEITINGEAVNAEKTIYHELVHRYLGSLNKDSDLYKAIQPKLEELVTLIKSDKNLLDRISKLYPSSEVNEELIANYISDIILNKVESIKNKSLLQKIQDIIDSILDFIEDLVALEDITAEELSDLSVEEFIDKFSNSVLKYSTDQSDSNSSGEQSEQKLPKDVTLEDIKQELSKHATVNVSPLSGHIIVNNNVQLDINQVDGSWHIISITSLEKNKGNATRAMGAITQAADNLNIVLYLEAVPLDTNGLTKAQLVDFYKKFGFTVTTGQYGMDNEADILEYTLNSEREPVEMARLPKGLRETEETEENISSEPRSLSQQEIDFINTLKNNSSELNGIYGNVIKDMLDMENYTGVIDLMHSQFVDDTKTAKSILGDKAYTAFLNLTGVQDGSSNVDEVLENSSNIKDMVEPDIEEQSPQKSKEEYVFYKENIDGKIETSVGRVISQEGMITTIERNGVRFDRLTNTLLPATEKDYISSYPKETSEETIKYKKGDRVLYGQDKNKYTITGDKKIKLEDDKEHVFYTTEEGVDILESAIHGYARLEPIQHSLNVKREHETRRRVLDRIGKRLQALFPQIKYEIGYFDFNAPARFNHGVVEINVGYGDRKYTQAEINAIESNDIFNVPWLKRESIAHEFMHPFIEAVKLSNKALYNNLAKEIQNNAEIMSHVDSLIKSGTYNESDRIDEAIAIFLGREITRAFDKSGIINREYIRNRKNNLVRRFLKWLNDVIDYITGRNKPYSLDEFIQKANTGVKYTEKNIRGVVNKKDKNGKFVYPDLDKLYKKHMDNSSFIRALNKELNILGNENFAEKYGITSKRDLDTLLTNIDDYITGNNKGNIIFGKRTNLKSTVEFEETDDNKLYVYIDPSGLNEISAPSFLTAFSNRIVDNELAKEYEKVINDNFYRKTKDKKDSKVMGVDALNPIMKLQDISDFLISQLDQDTASIESIEYTGYELSAIDELEKYMELSEPEAKKIRERVMRNWKGLQDIATKRLNNEDLKIQSNVIRRLDLDSQNDIEFVLRYTQQAAQAINLAVRKYGKLREELKSPGLTQAKLNRLNKELEVIKQLVSFYDEFNKLYSLYDESFNDADKIKFLKATSSLQYIRDSMANTAIDLTLEWLMPYIDKHNAELKKLGYSEKYMTTRQMMYNNLKFGTNKDTNFITFNLGTNVESRDPVNAAFANTISDNRSLQTLHIQNDTTELNIAYDNFLKENNISSVNYGAQIEFYKKHYYRQAEVLVFKIDEITGEKTEEYITKTALHQEFFFDKYEKDLSEVKKKYSNPRSGIEAEEFDTKIIEWQRANSFGKSEKYRNPEYHKLNSDKFFKVIENFYNINNAKYGENALNFGIIPQKYDANIIDKLQDFVKGVKAGKNVEEQYQFVKDKIVSSAAGMKKDNTSINLDGTVYRRIKTELTSMKQEKNISFDIKNVIEGFISEATDYSAMRDIQYNAETLRMLIEGNVKFSVPSRLIGKENFNARIKDDLTMGKVKSKFKELKDLKDAGLSYDKDLYEKLEEKIKKGVEKKSLWDDFLPRLKPSGTDMLNKMLIQQMNDFFYGDAVEDQKIGKISATKAAHYVSLYTSLVNMGLNWKAAISNINIGNLQLFIEGHGGKYFNKKELSEAIADYIKNIPNYARDLQVPIKSKDTQLAMLLDAIQGEVFDENRNRVTGSIAKRMFTVNNLFLLTNLGEHQIQITGMKAMLKGRKVETKNGEKITLYDAYTADKNGRYSLRTDLKDFTQEDLQKFIRELHGVNRNLNGNYSDLHKTTLARKWYGTLLLKFRKYLYPAFRSRFASEHIDYERNIVETGYLRFFFKDYLFGGLKRIIREHTIKGFSKEGFTEQEKYQFRKAVFELSSYAALTVLGMALGGGFSDDDKKKEISDFQKYLLYFTLRLRSDVGMYHVDMPSEFIRQIKNPTASLTAIVNGMGFIGQLWSPTEVYEKDSGTHEAGDSKLWAKAQKLIPVYNKFLVNIDDQLGYFNLINRNIEGVSPKRSTP